MNRGGGGVADDRVDAVVSRGTLRRGRAVGEGWVGLKTKVKDRREISRAVRPEPGLAWAKSYSAPNWRLLHKLYKERSHAARSWVGPINGVSSSLNSLVCSVPVNRSTVVQRPVDFQKKFTKPKKNCEFEKKIENKKFHIYFF